MVSVKISLYFTLYIQCFQASRDCSSERKCNCLTTPSGILADCSDKHLDYSPTFYDDVTSIDLSFNNLHVLPNNKELPRRLLHLNVSNNKVGKISTGGGLLPFSEITSLQTLNLSSNQIPLEKSVYLETLFKNFTNLTTLDISNNNGTDGVFDNLDKVLSPLISLTNLSLDLYRNVTFGIGFQKMTKLKFLKLTGTCDRKRVEILSAGETENFIHVEHFELSSKINWPIDLGFHFTKNINCSLISIERGAIANLPKLRYLDISYNRYLGLCGFKNVTQDLHMTNIKILKANYLHCDDGISVTLFCDDFKSLSKTRLEELHMDGNNLAYGQRNLISYLPSTLQYLSLKNNRWALGPYAYYPTYFPGLPNLTKVDISDIGKHQFSVASNESYPCCVNFIMDANCEKLRSKGIGTHLTPFLDGRCNSESELNSENEAVRSTPGNMPNKNESRSLQWECVVSLDQNNVEFTIVPPNIQEIIINNSRLGYEIPWTFFNTDTMLSLVLSNNRIYSLEGPLCNATNLKHFDLTGNGCSRVNPKFFTTLPNIQTLLLGNNLLGFSEVFRNHKSARAFFGAQENLVRLDLSSNKISILPEDIFWNLQNLKILNLNNNLLTDLDSSIQLKSHLFYLDLSRNQILSLQSGIKTINTVANRYLTVNLVNNPLQCTCGTFPFIKWITDIRRIEMFQSFKEYKCKLENRDTVSLLTAKTRLSIRCRSFEGLIILLVIILGFFIVLLIAMIIYRYRWKLRYWYYIAKREYLKGYQRLEERDIYTFDAFISYADEDRGFIFDQVMKNIEKEGNLRLCIHHRDFIPGCDIADNIINAIHQSRKTVFVLTNAFLRSKWCVYEVNMAHTEYIINRQGRNFMIVILKENISSKDIPFKILEIIQEQTYIEYPSNDMSQNQEFWQQFSKSLE